MSTTVIELENKDIVVKMSGQGPMGPRGQQGEPGPAGPSEWGVIQGNISDQTDLQNALDAKADAADVYTKTEADNLLAQKADADSVYTKTETDSLLADKADTDDVYSKTDVNNLLSGKADADTVYTKTETDTLLGAKADVGDSYTKAEEDALLAVKANSADVYTKTQTDTLLADKADADDVYTKDDVDDALADKADSADVYTKDETDEMLLDKAPVILNSASGSIASFTDGSASPVTALTVGIEPVQEGTGEPSPENVRPISGHDTAVVTRTGKNLCKLAESYESYTYNNTVTYSDTGCVVEASGNYGRRGYCFPVVSGYRYTVSYKAYGTDANYKRIFYGTKNKAWGTMDDGYLGFQQLTDTSASYSYSFTATSTDIFFFGIYVTSNSSSGSITVTDFQLELGSTASTYEPYQGTSVTIDLNGTRYGGTLNVLTGEMTVDVMFKTLTGNDGGSWELVGNNYKYFYLNRDYGTWTYSAYTEQMLHDDPRLKCNVGLVSYQTLSTVKGVALAYGYRISLPNFLAEDHTVAEFRTYLASNPIQIVIPLKNSQTVQLTPSQMQTLLGTNNIWADTGDVAVEYRADSKMYIDQSLQSQSTALKLMLTPNVETEMKASKNYTSGSIVIVNNDFIKLTSAVASGANLVIGSNCVKTTMAEWVASLTA